MIAEQILDMCCRHLGVTASQLTGKSQKADLVGPRHISMAVMRRAGLGVMEIAKTFQRDHSCVSHALTKITELTTGPQTDQYVRKTVHSLVELARVLITREQNNPLLEGPGYAGMTYLPTYKLRLSREELYWLQRTWEGCTDAYRLLGGVVLNAQQVYADWQQGKCSMGSVRLQTILHRVQVSHTHVLIVPLPEEKCLSRIKSPASSSAETVRAKRGNSSPILSVAQ